MPTSDFAEMLTLIEDRSAALRAAATKAETDARVPGCPDWSVRDLVAHLGAVQLFWAAAVAAGSVAAPPDDVEVGDQEPGDDLLAWSAASTSALLQALREAGPDRPCWAWWRASGAPMTSGAVARHQVQEAAVHAFDAQEAAGHAEPLPPGVALDGVGEFLTVGMASMGGWPHDPGRVALAAVDGDTWLAELTATGITSRATAVAGSPEPDAWLRGTASDLVLALYGRNLERGLAIDGDHQLATRLLGWTSND